MVNTAAETSLTDLHHKFSQFSLPLDDSTSPSSSSSGNLSPRSLNPPSPTSVTTTTNVSHAATLSPSTRSLDSSVLESVVKLFVTHCEPKHIRPWQMSAQTYTTSSGFILPGRLILTNAHSVQHHTIVRVKRRTSDIRYHADVLATAEECDLALLSVSDKSFWESSSALKPLTLGPLPKLRDSVVVAGYPHGGDGVSVTAGVVSRTELLDYTPASTLLSVQIDAAINPGNSGGPALDSLGRVVGVAFRVMSSDMSENIGYLVPPCVVHHFLQDVKLHGKYTGFPGLGFQWVDLEASAARRARKLSNDESGVVVRAVPNTSPAKGVLFVDDIITHVNGVGVSNAGTVCHEGSGERMTFSVLLAHSFINDDVKLRVFRSKDLAFHSVTYKLPDVNAHKLVPVHDREQTDYFVFGGLVFIGLTGAYLKSAYGTGVVSEARTPVQLRWLWDYGVKSEDEEQVVVLSHVLNAELNIHYEHVFDERVLKVNGKVVKNLKEMAKFITNCQDEFVQFELMEETIVLDRKEAVRENQSILDMHHIPKGCSFEI